MSERAAAETAWEMSAWETLQRLRAQGWRVAVHNDYMLDGVLHTFWGMTRGHVFVRGEGKTDAAALEEVVRGIERLTTSATGLGR